MAYIGANDVAAIRKELKAEFPEFKFSVRKGYNGSSVDVTVVSGPADFDELFNDDYSRSRKYLQINHYHTYMYGDHSKFFDKIVEIIKTAPARAGGKAYFNDSDAMVDYFHVAYYYHVNVGAWNKPYECSREYA